MEKTQISKTVPLLKKINGVRSDYAEYSGKMYRFDSGMANEKVVE